MSFGDTESVNFHVEDCEKGSMMATSSETGEIEWKFNPIQNSQPMSSPNEISTLKNELTKAVQHGELEKVEKLVKTSRIYDFDINFLDSDNATLLHWAAINGCLKVAQFLIENGSNLNALGGGCRSTPLMWAIHEKRTEMVLKLIKNGADPKIKDSKGADATHLAAAAGSLPILMYLVAMGCDVNEPDSRGLTPLMWACAKLAGINVIRFLHPLSTNAKFAQDYAEGNTALHWAIVSRSWLAASLFLKSGNIEIDIPNYAGETAKALIMKHLESRSSDFFLHRTIKADLEEAIRMKEKAGANRSVSNSHLCRQPTYKMRALLGCDHVLLVTMVVLLGAFLEWSRVHYLYKLSLIPIGCTIFFAYNRKISAYVLRNCIRISISAKIVLYLVWFIKVDPIVSYEFTLTLMIFSIGLWYNFLMACARDPGVIKPSDEEKNKVKMMKELVEGNLFGLNEFCPTCIIRRPLRSKHCSTCNHCVAKFDHHCDWIGNCVGAKNHLNFVWYITWLILCGICYSSGCLNFWITTIASANGIPEALMSESLILAVSIVVPVSCFWISSVLFTQFYQIFCAGLTTNERFNFGRYSYLKGQPPLGTPQSITEAVGTPCSKKNGLSAGCCLNCINFCELSCFPQYEKRDWRVTFADMETRKGAVQPELQPLGHGPLTHHVVDLSSNLEDIVHTSHPTTGKSVQGQR